MPTPVFTLASTVVTTPSSIVTLTTRTIDVDISSFVGESSGEWSLKPMNQVGNGDAGQFVKSIPLGPNLWQSTQSPALYYPKINTVRFHPIPNRREGFRAATGVVYQNDGIGGITQQSWDSSLGILTDEQLWRLTLSGAALLPTNFDVEPAGQYPYAIEIPSGSRSLFSFLTPLPTHLVIRGISGTNLDVGFARAVTTLDTTKFLLNVYAPGLPILRSGYGDSEIYNGGAFYGPMTDRLMTARPALADNLYDILFAVSGAKYVKMAGQHTDSAAGNVVAVYEYIPDSFTSNAQDIRVLGSSTPPSPQSLTVYYFAADSLPQRIAGTYPSQYPAGNVIGTETFSYPYSLLDTDGSTYWVFGNQNTSTQTLSPPTGAVFCGFCPDDWLNATVFTPWPRNRPAIPSYPVPPINNYGSMVPGVMVKM